MWVQQSCRPVLKTGFWYLVNHQKVMVDRKPAVDSGQGFWEGIHINGKK